MDKPLGKHHLFIEFWLTPWSWNKPKFWRSTNHGDWTLSFGIGQITYIID